MSKAIAEDILVSAGKCLDSMQLVSSIRPIVRERLSEYEECVDVSLSQQLELLSGLMQEYMSFCEQDEYEAQEVGEEPLSYADALRLVDHFIDVARREVSDALRSSKFLFRAMEIGVRAQTFATILRWKDQARSHEEKSES